MSDSKYYLIVISGPSGAGKSTLVEALVQEPDYQLSVSCTTRKMRATEKDGMQYYFISHDEFKKRIQEEQFLEYAEYDGNYYGTLIQEIERITKKAHCLLDIDVQGAEIIRKKSTLKDKTIFIFIEPPDLDSLIQRLKKRGNNPDFHLEARIELSKREMREKDKFDRVFQNQNQEQMIQEVKCYLKEKQEKGNSFS